MDMERRTPTLPTFGEIVPGTGGRLGAIMRGALVDGVRQSDYAVIVPEAKAANLGNMPWGEYGKDVAGAASLTDGMANTIAMAGAGSAAALKVRELEIEGHRDFYIPSRGEMWALRANVPELFDKEWHWTSTQDGRHDAFVQNFAGGDSGWYGKDVECRVRAVRRIQLQHFGA
jgi:hypothetical protein